MTIRTTPTRLFPVLAATGVLALTGCAGADDTGSAETVTETQTSELDGGDAEAPAVTETVPATVNPGAPNPPPPPQDSPAADVPTTGAPDRELPYGPVGSEVTIAGEPATICIHGDGWGTNIWAGNANTSCEFVVETHYALVEGLNATTDNIRNHLKEKVTVQSPVTGQDYDLTCMPRDERLVTCTGGENAAVHFY